MHGGDSEYISFSFAGQNTSTDDEYTNGEKKLLKELFVGYNPALRPVKNHSHAVWVEFGAALYTLNNLVGQKTLTSDYHSFFCKV